MKNLLLASCAIGIAALTGCTHTTPLTVGANTLPAALPPYAFTTVDNEQLFVDSVNDKVFFAFNRAYLRPSAKRILDEQAAWLSAHPGVSVLIAGNADPRGTRAYNYGLAQRRADTTRNYLINDGVAPSRIKTISYGKDCPIAFGHSWKDYALDRNTITSIQGFNPQAACHSP